MFVYYWLTVLQVLRHDSTTENTGTMTFDEEATLATTFKKAQQKNLFFTRMCT